MKECKGLFYDKEFDTTNYNIINENAEYSRVKNSLDSEEFKLYLAN